LAQIWEKVNRISRVTDSGEEENDGGSGEVEIVKPPAKRTRASI
jgi:hypothetical protein